MLFKSYDQELAESYKNFKSMLPDERENVWISLAAIACGYQTVQAPLPTPSVETQSYDELLDSSIRW